MQDDKMSLSNKAINSVKKQQIEVLKSLKSPPKGIIQLFRWIGIFLNQDLHQWKNSQKIMGNPKAFIQRLMKLDRSFSEKKIDQIKTKSKQFGYDQPDAIKTITSKSQTAGSLLQWGIMSLQEAQQMMIK